MAGEARRQAWPSWPSAASWGENIQGLPATGGGLGRWGRSSEGTKGEDQGPAGLEKGCVAGPVGEGKMWGSLMLPQEGLSPTADPGGRTTRPGTPPVPPPPLWHSCWAPSLSAAGASDGPSLRPRSWRHQLPLSSNWRGQQLAFFWNGRCPGRGAAFSARRALRPSKVSQRPSPGCRHRSRAKVPSHD